MALHKCSSFSFLETVGAFDDFDPVTRPLSHVSLFPVNYMSVHVSNNIEYTFSEINLYHVFDEHLGLLR